VHYCLHQHTQQASSSSRTAGGASAAALEKATRAAQHQQAQAQQQAALASQAARARGPDRSGGSSAAAAAAPGHHHRPSALPQRGAQQQQLQQQQLQQGQLPLDNLTFVTPTHDGDAAAQQQQQHAAAEEMLPEHLFAIQMARAQPWKDRLVCSAYMHACCVHACLQSVCSGVVSHLYSAYCAKYVVHCSPTVMCSMQQRGGCAVVVFNSTERSAVVVQSARLSCHAAS
jgi:hypothetical protein